MKKNFWSGRWRSTWKISYEDKKFKISGSMKVNIHYYERGNVQLNTQKEYAETVNVNSEDDVPKEVVKVLSKVESNFQKDIDASCNNLSETFKSLRRRLPITGVLFDFSGGQSKLVEGIMKGF